MEGEDTPTGWDAVVASVQSLDGSLRDAVKERAKDREEMQRLGALVQEHSEKFEPRTEAAARARKMRLVATALGLVVVVVLALVIAFHAEDSKRVSHDKKEALAQAADTRSTLLAGCERSNDQRATLRQVIEKAVVASPAPPGLPDDLQALYQQSQVRVAALRADLLGLPGVQPVNCETAFPPLPADR